MRLKSVGLLLAAGVALTSAPANAQLSLSMANGQKTFFGLADCNADAKRVVVYEGAPVGSKLAIFMVSGTCPDEAPTDAVILKAETTIDSAGVSGTLENLSAKKVTGGECPINKTIEKRICAVTQIKQYGYTEEWVDGEKAELLLTYDSEQPGAPSITEATGGEGLIYLGWEGGEGVKDWVVCIRKVGEPVEQSEDPCAAFKSETQALGGPELGGGDGCSDGVQNGEETGVDCGGACGACPGATCAQASECASGVCSGETAKTCQAATCSDTVENGQETDADCGGSCPAKCADTKKCSLASDCLSGVCTDSVCKAPACDDEVKNGEESATDCGGSKCGGCGNGEACAKASDCSSGVCTDKVCAMAVNENPLTGCNWIKEFTGSATRKGTIDELAKDVKLVNGQQYELQMAARDEAGNYSPASNVKTATPQLVYDFYERYRCAGGTEEGGFGCSSGGMALLPLAGLAALGLLRRRKGSRSEK